MANRKIVVPGEVIVKGEDYLPGEGTEKKAGGIVALRYGLSEESNRLVKVIPLSGVYAPRRGNVVIGRVNNITFNGWVIDIGTAENAFLPLMEVPRFVNKDVLEEVMDTGDMAIVKVWNINKRGIDLSIKSRGLGKIDEGIIGLTAIDIGRIGLLCFYKAFIQRSGGEIWKTRQGILWSRSSRRSHPTKPLPRRRRFLRR